MLMFEVGLIRRYFVNILVDSIRWVKFTRKLMIYILFLVCFMALVYLSVEIWFV